MTIRSARIEDTKAIAQLLLLAMQEIVFEFIGVKSTEKAVDFLERLVGQKANQYSYTNCWVIENDNTILAVANVYDGARLNELRTPVIELIKSAFYRDINPEDETQEGEFYIDCIAVLPDQQGNGLGTQLLQFLIEKYVIEKKKNLGLLVDRDNPDAKRLYLKLGFEAQEELVFAGKKMQHLQISSKNKPQVL